MKIIALVKLPLQPRSQKLSYGSLAGAGYTRDHDYHVGFDGSIRGWTDTIRIGRLPRISKRPITGRALA